MRINKRRYMHSINTHTHMTRTLTHDYTHLAHNDARSSCSSAASNSAQSRAATYHSALKALTIKHTQLQSTHSTTLTTVDSLKHQTAQQSRTIHDLQQTITTLHSDNHALQQSHKKYRSDVYHQVEQLKADFVATQRNHEAALAYYREGGEGRQRQLDAMKRKLAAYKQQMGEQNGQRRRVRKDERASW